MPNVRPNEKSSDKPSARSSSQLEHGTLKPVTAPLARTSPNMHARCSPSESGTIAQGALETELAVASERDDASPRGASVAREPAAQPASLTH